MFAGLDEEKEDEKNLAYVAVTRAKKYLELCDTIRKAIGIKVSEIIVRFTILPTLFILARFNFLDEGDWKIQ